MTLILGNLVSGARRLCTSGFHVPSHLSKELNGSSVEQARSPGFNLEHYCPARCRNRFLSVDGEFDLVELLVDPILVGTVVMQFVQDFQGFVGAVRFDKVPRRFREEHNTTDDHEARNALESEWKAPGE